MKITVVALCMIVTISCFAQKEKKLGDISKVKWLTGTWTRTNAKPGRSANESWDWKSQTEMIGHALMMKGTDTTMTEKFRIVLKDDQLFFVADVPENNGEIWFQFTELSDKSFVVENPKHDFPKKIEYYLEGNALKATISGDGKAIDYLFVKN